MRSENESYEIALNVDRGDGSKLAALLDERDKLVSANGELKIALLDEHRRYEEQYRVSQGLAREVQDLRRLLDGKCKLLGEIALDLKEMSALVEKL